ncbi:alkaline phosphatase [Candidatus Berkelbacteria bacterium CG08_land_8_20_14_0_20_39_8]|uniref:Alkaline phosphatase n=1 Tax=Candidatus Berkelbacteria bacterium CG08_land_8_20_14_0_20_39_8 TaxID=1974511 RepID=A0A2M6YCN3_9BACT|nr:MAG: alkaline phosphatase [Candidatus Berkelbacteria bacterium CG08_land_8_20_14_0_20_39_8]
MIIDTLANFATGTISHLGYWGVFFLMALESACIPIPSEVIMPFAGFLVSSGQFGFVAVVIVGSLGNMAGSFLAFWAGYRGGRPLIEKYGKYILLSQKDLDSSDKFFKKYGDSTVFFARLLPVVRTFISLPAGISKMSVKKFSIYTLAGVIPFTALLTWAGVILRQNWENLRTYFHRFDLIIGLAIILLTIWYIIRHLKRR